jgi:hypothetical protein
MAAHVHIGQGTLTPLYGSQFDGLRELLAAQNPLPDFLRQARYGELGFRSVNGENWPAVSCAPGARFIREEQLRAYLLDFLLGEIKDEATLLLEECHCYRGGDKTGGIADYFICVHGRWLPVEAKLNILVEADLLGQVARYTRVDSVVPSRGAVMGSRIPTDPSAICLVVDQSGLYVLADGRYLECAAGEPLWRRETLGHASRGSIREWLAGVFADGHP